MLSSFLEGRVGFCASTHLSASLRLKSAHVYTWNMRQEVQPSKDYELGLGKLLCGLKPFKIIQTCLNLSNQLWNLKYGWRREEFTSSCNQSE